MAWNFSKEVTLETCYARNQNRKRQVPDYVITSMFEALKDWPPVVAEGFVDVCPVPFRRGQIDFDAIENRIQHLPVARRERQKSYREYQAHDYSHFLDFERLMFLISLLIRYPGLGILHQTQPERLTTLLGDKAQSISNSISEVQALMTRHCGPVYADPKALQADLDWLESHGLVNNSDPAKSLVLTTNPMPDPLPLSMCHPYSGHKAFEQLISELRFISHSPFIDSAGDTVQEALIKTMASRGLLPEEVDPSNNFQISPYVNKFQYDIRHVFKPYGIMTQKPYRKGYFLGTGILNSGELLRVFKLLENQAQKLKDSTALEDYQNFQQRLKYLKLDSDDSHSVRTVLHRPIVDTSLSEFALSLAHDSELIEQAIREAKKVTLRFLKGSGRFGSEDDQSFEVLPIQIGFYKIGWYLGYQRQDGRIAFDRLDRLVLHGGMSMSSFVAEQDRAQQQLEQLLDAGWGIHMGREAEEQRAFLNPKTQATVEETVELWFATRIFRFVSAGTQRLPKRLTMSPRPDGAPMSQMEHTQIFTELPTKDVQFPHRFKAIVPRWVVREDVDFRRWILGFAGEVKVIAPEGLRQEIQQQGADICKVYI
ncbi:WYL domain-containing protein [Synechococcales cyanobacterium C]|uniref:WYL domain-containing protein n=1 Tax=Petrachloros mirabilis ULC683 TaxID=2781853 RepID=A0A8K2A8D2_9CYAN|nr:WYL domain-containing protein [Petrachloros mirabilis]NCJ07089.1 WYL domain-containing protein [Petrachloros mirabilis ULC683]